MTKYQSLKALLGIVIIVLVTIWATLLVHEFLPRVGVEVTPMEAPAQLLSTIDLQRVLNRRYPDLKLAEDGVYGPATEAAHVRAIGDQYAKELMVKEVHAMEYVIKWKSKLTGKTGEGTKRFKKWDAAEQVAKANRIFPDIDHWYEESTP